VGSALSGHGRRYAGVGALAMVLFVGSTACGQPPVSPLPIQTPQAMAASTVTVSTTPPSVLPTTPAPQVTLGRRIKEPISRPTRTSPSTTPSTSPSPSHPPSCLGAVQYELDAAAPESAMTRSLCFSVGAQLVIRNAGPGVVEAEPGDLMTQRYEAGTVVLTFIATGTVTVAINRDQAPYTIAVVIRESDEVNKAPHGGS
jgi:hypothetical protein